MLDDVRATELKGRENELVQDNVISKTSEAMKLHLVRSVLVKVLTKVCSTCRPAQLVDLACMTLQWYD